MKKYKITKEQVLELADLGYENKLKKWFPEVFEAKLEVGRWYKGTYLDDKNDLLFISNLDEKMNLKGFGVSYVGNWFDCRKETLHYGNIEESNDWTLATDTEVLEALTNEAVKRGFGKKNVYFIDCLSRNFISTGKFSFHNGKVENNGITNGANGWIFRDGKWAEIIPTLTKKEAEEKLNCKII